MCVLSGNPEVRKVPHGPKFRRVVFQVDEAAASCLADLIT